MQLGGGDRMGCSHSRLASAFWRPVWQVSLRIPDPNRGRWADRERRLLSPKWRHAVRMRHAAWDGGCCVKGPRRQRGEERRVCSSLAGALVLHLLPVRGESMSPTETPAVVA